MCLIIIKQKSKEVSADVLKSASKINRDGLGVVWLDTYEVSYHKSKEYEILNTDRPYIAHFRYATVGKVCIENTHPFVCGKNENELLMMNGTIRGLGDANKTDSKVLAESLGDIERCKWRDELAKHPCRFVTINTKTKSFEIFNKHLYTLKNGVWYSKDEVHYIAVYGTLRKGNSNYWSYLYGSTHVGKGKTQDKYPLLIEGLPYLIDKKGVGHNVSVDVFKITDSTLKKIDGLEGHPNWYKRKQITIMVGKKEVLCWVYFNPKTIHSHSVMHQSYEQVITPKKTYGFETYPLVPSAPIEKDKSLLDECTQYTFWEDKWDDFDTIKTHSPVCVGCYGDVINDNFGNYYCNKCDSWYSESEVIKF
jgi:gamma-glutamylcyclotransferase (GGCT)/AIG2-like uncharacterized protein YtfP